MKLIVGLGNPGKKYEMTRHNFGFLALDALSGYAGIPFDQVKRKCRYGKGRYLDTDLVLLQPQTFMNLSGEAVLYLASFYRILPSDIIVICDDVSLPFGRMRIRTAGSHGGHNGLRSIADCLNSDAFPRIRLGVGSPQHPSHELSSFVLERFSDAESGALERILRHLPAAVASLVQNSPGKAMNEFNGKDLLAD